MKLLILDKDGTLTTPKSGAKFVQHPEDQALLPGVLGALEKYAAEGWAMAIASNQGGVAAGHKSLEQAIEEMQYCQELLPHTIGFRFYFCPDFEGKKVYAGDWRGFEPAEWPLEDQVNYRKPNGGMLELAMMETRESSKAETLFVGDLPEDEQAAANAGVRFMWADEWRARRRESANPVHN